MVTRSCKPVMEVIPSLLKLWNSSVTNSSSYILNNVSASPYSQRLQWSRIFFGYKESLGRVSCPKISWSSCSSKMEMIYHLVKGIFILKAYFLLWKFAVTLNRKRGQSEYEKSLSCSDCLNIERDILNDFCQVKVHEHFLRNLNVICSHVLQP